MSDILPLGKLLDLSGKVAIVTGGAMGIGFGIVSRLTEAGANVVIADLKQEAADKAAADLSAKGLKAKAFVCDVSKEADVKALVVETVSAFGEVHILVNNAGIFPNITLANLTSAEFEKIVKVNLEGAYLCTKYVSDQMKKQGKGGKIINITSIDALHPSSIGLATYDATKHGLWGFTKNVALELAEYQIWVNAIAPGGIATPGAEAATKGTPSAGDMSKMTEAFLAKIPMHRMGNSDDIGKVALFLASDMSSYMTGAQIVVDGGVLLS